MPRKIEISHRTVVFTALFLILLWFLFFIKDIIFTLFVSLLLMTILNPFVKRLTKWHFPRALSIFLVYLLIVGVVSLAVAVIAPPLVEQTTNFVSNVPVFLKNPNVGRFINNQTFEQFFTQLGSVPGQVLKVGVSVFSDIVAVISVLILTFYMLLYRDRLDDQIGIFFGDEGKTKVGRVLDNVEKSLGGWARGQFILMVVVGLLIYIGLTILGIPYALPLAVLAAILEIVPTIGPIVATIPAIIIGLTISPVVGLAVAALAFLINQAENYVLVPKIMEKSVGVNPIVTLTSLAIGFKLLGVVGAIISVPVVLTLQIIVKEYLQNK
jgi:predicted PurR-regulated permease PerM